MSVLRLGDDVDENEADVVFEVEVERALDRSSHSQAQERTRGRAEQRVSGEQSRAAAGKEASPGEESDSRVATGANHEVPAGSSQPRRVVRSDSILSTLFAKLSRSFSATEVTASGSPASDGTSSSSSQSASSASAICVPAQPLGATGRATVGGSASTNSLSGVSPRVRPASERAGNSLSTSSLPSERLHRRRVSAERALHAEHEKQSTEKSTTTAASKASFFARLLRRSSSSSSSSALSHKDSNKQSSGDARNAAEERRSASVDEGAILRERLRPKAMLSLLDETEVGVAESVWAENGGICEGRLSLLLCEWFVR